MRRLASRCLALGTALGSLVFGPLAATLAEHARRPQGREPEHGARPTSLEIKNVIVVKGDRTPPTGPQSVYVRDGVIVAERIEEPASVIDGQGGYLLPGFVSTHSHLQEESGGMPLPQEYQLDLWLACGITTIRDNGSTFARSLRLREKSKKGEIAAPRILLYKSFGQVTSVEEARARVGAFKESGADGIKLWSNASYDRDLLAAILQEAKTAGLLVTAHMGVGSTNAIDYAELGAASIEHWYGIPDAALDGVQRFPAEFNYANELHRFRWAGRLWRETKAEKLGSVLQYLVDQRVAWSPTLAVYEATRDLTRAQSQPWFKDYLHPALEAFFAPNLANHGSFFVGWTTADEVAWRENYRIWMDALLDFARRGGVVTTGEDAGYIYLLYGFGFVRELELQQEAGFHPLEVVAHATWNGAKTLGMEQRFGRIRAGLSADLVLVDGNPLENLKVLYPGGADTFEGGKSVHKAGIPLDAQGGPLLLGTEAARRGQGARAQGARGQGGALNNRGSDPYYSQP
jgi:imidazolonepropionase-like amidohydrolase